MPGHHKDSNENHKDPNTFDIRDFISPTTPAEQLAIDAVLKKRAELGGYGVVPRMLADELPKPTQLGNINEDNTLAFIMAGGPVFSPGGFTRQLYKSTPSVMRKIINKGKDFASTRIGKLVMKHADDVFNVASSSGGLNK